MRAGPCDVYLPPAEANVGTCCDGNADVGVGSAFCADDLGLVGVDRVERAASDVGGVPSGGVGGIGFEIVVGVEAIVVNAIRPNVCDHGVAEDERAQRG